MAMEELPLVAWLAGLVIFLLLAGGLVYVLRAKGLTYGLNFFLSVPFALLFVTATITYAAAAAPLFMMDEGVREAAVENLVWGSGIFLGALALGYLGNALRSTFLFAIPYTLAQGVVASLSALVVVFLLLRTIDKDRKIPTGGS